MPTTGMKCKTAVFGGSFDPIHLGHLHLLHEVAERTDIGHVILIPALISNFKQNSNPASFFQRVEMARLAIEDFKEIYPADNLALTVSTIEGDRGGISYSSDTVRALLPDYGVDGKLFFLIGDDILENLDKWHDFDYLKEHVIFICFPRDGVRRSAQGAEIIFVDAPVFPASSTKARAGDEGMLSKRVYAYAKDHGLYKA